MRRWQRRYVSVILTLVLLFCNIPASGGVTEREDSGSGETRVAIASDSDAIVDEDEIFQEMDLIKDTKKTLITGVTITSKPNKPVKVGAASFKLRRTVAPIEADKLVTNVWSSLDDTVATIDLYGNVTAVGAGTTTITITITGKAPYEGTATDAYDLTVLPAEEESTEVTEVKITGQPTEPVKQGDNPIQLNYEVTPQAATVTSIWDSSKSEVATVDSTGKVTIAGVGTTTISVTVTGTTPYEGTKTASFALTVAAEGETGKVPLTGVSITGKPTAPKQVGDAVFRLGRSVTPSQAAIDKTITTKWSSEDQGVATIDNAGNVTIVGVGTTKIQVSVSGYGNYEGTVIDSFILTVEEPAPPVPITGVVITSKPNAPKHVGDSSFKLRRTITPEDAKVTDTWESTKPTVATIDKYGNVTILEAGTTTIKLSVTGVEGYEGTATDSYDLTIHPERGEPVPLTKVVITGKPTAPKYVGDLSFKVRYTTTPYGGTITPTWTSSNPSAASIDLYGNITIVGPGKTTIQLEGVGKEGYSGTVTDSFVLTVLPVSMILNKNEVFLDRGESADIQVKVAPENMRVAKVLPEIYETEDGETISWNPAHLNTTSLENGRFPSNTLTIEIPENLPEDVAYGSMKMELWLLAPEAEAEDVLAKEEITIYFREKKASTLPPVKPGVPRVDRIKTALEQMDFEQLTTLEKKELANEVLESMATQQITVRHTIGNDVLRTNLKAVEEMLEELLGRTGEIDGDSAHMDAISFMGALFNVPGGKTPVLKVEDEPISDTILSGMGVLPTCQPVALDIKLTTADGNIISKLQVPMELRIDVSDLGLDSSGKIVIKHMKNDGTATFLPYEKDGSQIIFWVSDYSTFVFANGTTNAQGGTGSGGSSGGGGGSGGGSGGGGGGGGGSTRAVAGTIPMDGAWKQDALGWKYVYTNGSSPANGWVLLTWNGKADWYHFNGQSYADGGWLQTGGHTYYLNPLHNGQYGMMMTGWQQIDGKWYYFQTEAGGPQGAMLREAVTPDGYFVGLDGVRR